MITNQDVSDPAQSEKVERVRSFFDHKDNYLPKRRLDIRLRAETVRTLVQSRNFKDILDIGCGDGSISLPLLIQERKVTLLDLSPNMLSIAKAQIPGNLAGNVKFINQDFLVEEVPAQSFDLVICLGVIAHVTSPALLIAKIASVLRSGGTLILEWTDSFHFVGLITVLYTAAAGIFKAPPYKVNLLSSGEVLRMCERESLESTDAYRYALPLPMTGRFFSPSGLYIKTRAFFGDVQHNRNAWLGNQHIHCFTRR